MEFVDKIKTLMSFPPLASEHGKKMDDFIIYIHLLMAVLFVGWFAYFLYAIFRFRKSNNPKASYTGAQTNISTYAEVAVAVAEVILLVGLAIPLWASVVDADKFPKEEVNPIVIKVTGQQFAWNTRYPGKDGAFGKQDIKFVAPDNKFGVDKNDPNTKDDFDSPLNLMAVPVGRAVIIHLSSLDVIHCFKVVPLRITQDAIPGLMIPMHFKATKEGKYMVTCAQLCGNGHATMRGNINVLSEADYKKWEADLASKAGGTATSFE
ncbi:MAG: cytochrome c oxidase subunit II [Pedosphaera sp.]|nr:cytochrome c oxidase subunit II [Pedosphaera sp.]